MAGSDHLIGGRWRVEAGRPLGAAGGGLPAFVATDLAEDSAGTGLIAIKVARDAPARAVTILNLQRGGPLRGVLMPLGVGAAPGPDGVLNGFVICPAPPGAPVVENLRPWPEHDIIDLVLKPAAAVLEGLRVRGATHRAIRPNNVFAARADRHRQPVVLGCAWAAPPAVHQPTVFEPPYSATCAPSARGDGSIADDIYALAVLLLTLALGRVPMAALDAEAVIRRKLEMGSHAALTDGERLPPSILDLTRGMLAEDPDHRPQPALLTDSAAARARRVAARPPRRAQRAQELAGEQHWNTRTLALACAREPKLAVAQLQSGAIEGWLRRYLGDSVMAAQLEETLRLNRAELQGGDPAANSRLLMRAVAILDPLSAPCWRGVLAWPDGLGPALAAGGDIEPLLDLVSQEAFGLWEALQAGGSNALRLEARRWRTVQQTGNPALGAARLRYDLNPLLPCVGRVGWLADIRDVLPTLDRMAGESGRPSQPIDAEMAAFIASRLESRADIHLALGIDEARSAPGLQPLRVTSMLQQRFGPPALPSLAAWLAAAARPVIDSWPSKRRRETALKEIEAVIAQGQLSGLLAILDDREADRVERERLGAVREALQQIDQQITLLTTGARHRRARAEAFGQAFATGMGAVALATSLLLALL